MKLWAIEWKWYIYVNLVTEMIVTKVAQSHVKLKSTKSYGEIHLYWAFALLTQFQKNQRIDDQGRSVCSLAHASPPPGLMTSAGPVWGRLVCCGSDLMVSSRGQNEAEHLFYVIYCVDVSWGEFCQKMVLTRKIGMLGKYEIYFHKPSTMACVRHPITVIQTKFLFTGPSIIDVSWFVHVIYFPTDQHWLQCMWTGKYIT